LIVHVHGGPAAAVTDRWFNYPLWNFNLLSSRGAFVFSPNFHGSSDYGLDWAESVIGRLTKLEVQDVEQGVDYLIQQGLVAPDKLALSGWSYGGGLVGALTVATNRYKAAISGDGPIDWVNYWARSDVGASFCGNYFGKSPLEDPSALMRASSFYQMANVTTPTLIFFGANDSRVPVEQGWMYYRALQRTGKAEARFVLFPEEGHGPSKISSLRRTIEEELAWYDKYLFGIN
jgi:dipeptidyl aminopeptidase/acylaminoacyl peptidase